MADVFLNQGGASTERDQLLFTNILHSKGREAAEDFLARRSTDEVLQRRARVILDILEGQTFGPFDDSPKSDPVSGD